MGYIIYITNNLICGGLIWMFLVSNQETTGIFPGDMKAVRPLSKGIVSPTQFASSQSPLRCEVIF
jgi:hypothetical protein